MSKRFGIGICPFCAQVVLQGERMYYEVIGWEEGRRQGGTNALRLRNRTSAVAHWLCVDKASRGLDGQLALPVPSDTVSYDAGSPAEGGHE